MAEASPPPIIFEPGPEWADPWAFPNYYLGITVRRIYAYLLDIVVVALLCGVVLMAALILGMLSFGLLWAPMMVVMGLVPVVYHVLCVGGLRQSTFGMRAARIKVLSVAPGASATGGRLSFAQALVQGFGFYLTVPLTFWLILLVALFNPRRRTVHDMLAGVVVVNDPVRWKNEVSSPYNGQTTP